MKKVLAIVTAVTVLSIGAFAFAGPGWFGGHMGSGYGGHMGYGNGGSMMGPGYGNHMGYGGGMMGYGNGYGYNGSSDKKFLNETRELRRELHTKQFEYREAVRNPKTDEKTITTLEKEITDLQDRINEKSPRTARGIGVDRWY
jgi:hypothetical protein